MIDIIAGVLLFGGAAIFCTILAIMFAQQLLAGRAVKRFVQGDAMGAWQEQMDSAWTLTISYSLMAAGAWGLLIFGIITELQ